jgi:hypothetical protein
MVNPFRRLCGLRFTFRLCASIDRLSIAGFSRRRSAFGSCAVADRGERDLGCGVNLGRGFAVATEDLSDVVCVDHREEIEVHIVMPRMSGPEMVANMTSEDLDLPVLYTTGFTDNKRLLDNGEIREGVNLLPKPYTTKVLAGRIREVLDAAVA